MEAHSTLCVQFRPPLRLDSLLLFHFPFPIEVLLIIKHFFSAPRWSTKIAKSLQIPFVSPQFMSNLNFSSQLPPVAVAFYAGKWNRNRQQPSISELSRFLRVFLLHSLFCRCPLIGLFHRPVCEASGSGKGDRGRKIVNNIFYAPCLMPFRNKWISVFLHKQHRKHTRKVLPRYRLKGKRRE